MRFVIVVSILLHLFHLKMLKEIHYKNIMSNSCVIKVGVSRKVIRALLLLVKQDAGFLGVSFQERSLGLETEEHIILKWFDCEMKNIGYSSVTGLYNLL